MALQMKLMFLVASVFLMNNVGGSWVRTLSDVLDKGISEDTPIDTSLGTLFFNSPQANPVIYSSNRPQFKVNPLTGDVRLGETLVYRRMNNMLVTFSAKDGNNAASPIGVQVKILPVNHPPYFDSSSYRFSVKDNVPVNTVVYNSINVIDQDEGVNGTVDVVCDATSNAQSCNYFTITSSSVGGFDDRKRVIITLKAQLNQNINPKTFKIRATDKGTPPLTSTVDLNFIVENSQDSRPVFVGSPYLIQLVENDFNPNKDLATVQIRDARTANNANSMKLSIEGDINDMFTTGPVVTPTVGVYSVPIRLKKPLNLASNNFNSRYTFTVKATQTLNGQDLNVFSRSLVTVNIEDINDITPTFNQNQYTAQVTEGLANGATVSGLLMLVSDQDNGDNNKYALSLQAQAPLEDGVFDVSPSTGQGNTAVGLVVKRPGSIRYDTDPSRRTYNLIVKATETDTIEKRSSTASITIQVLPPTNNRPPYFPDNLNPIILSDLAAVDSVISTFIKAEDSDSGLNGRLIYSITNEDNSQTYFKIDPTSGVLSLKTKLDASVTSSFTFDAVATDGGGLMASNPIRIDVIDTEGPQFKPTFYNANVNELTTNTIPQIRVKAEFGGLVSDRVIEYRLVDQGDFKVNDFFMVDSSGLVTMKKGVDYNEAPGDQGLFEFQVEAAVVNTPEIPVNRATIRVNVIDINNNAPKFLPNSIYRETIKETTLPNTQVTRLTVSDDDTGLNAQIRYLLLDGARNDFVVDANGWVITSVNAQLEPERFYDMKVLAIDGGQPPLSATATVLINITDVIKDTPTFNTNEYVFIVREDVSTNSLIGSVVATTTEKRAILSYRFVQDSWNAYDKDNNLAANVAVWNWFSLNEETAELSVKSPLSYQQVAKATVNVSAEVTNMEVDINPKTAYVLVTINIYPVDSNLDQVVFSPFRESFYFEVVEGQPVNTPVYNFDAFSIRTNSPIRNFKLTSLDADQLETFLVERETGIMKSIRKIVYVQTPNKNFTFDLEALASPPSNAIAKAVVVVHILPLSSDPVFDKSEYTFYIKNTSPRFSYVGGVKAANPFLNQGRITYSLVNPSNLFQIDSNNGNITLQRPLDSQQGLYNLFVKAQSSNATHTFSSNILVKVEVLFDKTLLPRFENAPYRFLVPNLSTGPVGRVVAFDPNPFNPSQITYSIYNSTIDRSLVTINSETGIIEATQPLNKDATLVVVATSFDNSSFTNHTTVHLQTFLPTSQTPTFTYPNFTNIEALGSDPSSFSLQVQGEPTQPGSKLEYFIDPSTPANNLFVIDRNTGLMRFRQGVNIPSGFNSYQIFLQISDEFSTQWKLLNVDVYGNGSPSFNCYQSSSILNANSTPGLLSPPINIPTPTDCSDNPPSTQYFYKIIKINDLDINDSPFRDWFKLHQVNQSAVSVNATRHLFFRDNLKNKLTIAVGNSQADLNAAISEQRTSSYLESTIQINPYFSPGPSFASNLVECPGSGNNVVTGILDLTPSNTPVFKMVAGDCDIDPARPNIYTIDSFTYVGPQTPYSGEPQSWQNNDQQPFVINSLSGLVLTNLPEYSILHRGHFDLQIKATSPFGKENTASLKVYILREFQKLKMTINKPTLQARNQNKQFIKDLNTELQPSSLIVVPDEVSTMVNKDGSRNTAKSSLCYFPVNSEVDVVDVSRESIEKITQAIKKLNATFAVEDVDDECYVRVGSTEEWSGKRVFWWVTIAFSILVFLVALILACCICFFWPMNVREMAKARPYIVLDEPQISMAGSVFDYK